MKSIPEGKNQKTRAVTDHPIPRGAIDQYKDPMYFNRKVPISFPRGVQGVE